MSDTTPEPEAEPAVAPEVTPFSDPAAVEDDPAAPVSGDAPAGEKLGRAPKQTLAGRVWIAIGCAAVLLVLIIIFIAENSRSTTISFLGAHGHIPLALALLIAVVAGIVITLLVGSARIVQLTLEVRRHRRRIRELT
jgi:uncharacterized integral membrane protein